MSLTDCHRSRTTHRPSFAGSRSALVCLLIGTLSISADAQDNASAAAGTPPPYRIETLAQGLDFPWCVAFLPDGQMLVTERGGNLRYVGADGSVSEPISNTPAPYVASQGGLFDVLLAPDFATSRTIYLSLAAGSAEANGTQVVRATLNGMALDQSEVIFSVAFEKDTPVHYGGRLAWDATGHLLLTTGDGFDYRELAQDTSNQLGKILRMTATGEPPAVPAIPGADPYVLSFGHRNPQGLAVDTNSGAIYLHEHGPRGGDEVNLIGAGKNYGWPMVSYGIDYSGALISPYNEIAGVTPPLLHWTPSTAASGLAVYQGDAFAQWQGDLLAGALVEKSLRRVDIENGKVVGQDIMLTELDERIRDVRVGPDGLIYVLTDSAEGRLLRVSPR